jgi:phosphate-selective porin
MSLARSASADPRLFEQFGAPVDQPFVQGVSGDEVWVRASAAVANEDSPLAIETPNTDFTNLAGRLYDLERRFDAFQTNDQKTKAEAAKRPSVKFGGRIDTDWVYYSQSDENIATVGPIVGETINAYGIETAVVGGPWSIQSEYIATSVDQATGADVVFQGAYAYVSWFLTGETRKYERSVFSSVKPYENFFSVETDEGICCGKGAWEAAARWSWMDLNDENIAGGELQDLTFGLNWYLNPYTKVMFNYIHAFLDRNGVDSDADIFATRVHIDF